MKPPGLPPIPIDAVLPEIVRHVRDSGRLVLQAPPGAGKTTRVPAALLDAGLAGEGRVVVLQPRRLAARAAAARIARERGEALGGEIGYQVRFESCVTSRTRLTLVTEGIFIRMLADDPFLEGVSVVVFDEFHERSLNADLALAMTRRVRQAARPDLKIVVMSATLDAEPVAAYLAESGRPAPVVTSLGRSWPVEIAYLQHEPAGRLVETVVEGVARVVGELERAGAAAGGEGQPAPGSILVFLPGVGEIRRVADSLADVRSRGWAITPLYGEMPLEEQQAALRPGPAQKIVLATNVAETSLTIEGVTAVVDSGWVRQMRSEPGLGINRLALERISRASADQRAGRAGRTAPGTCLRLWTERRQQSLEAQHTPEVRRLDLAGAVLELLVWGENDLAAFPWFERPTAPQLAAALALLELLGAAERFGTKASPTHSPGAVAEAVALDVPAARATELGRRLVRLPLDPRLARLVVAGQALGVGREAALAAAMLSERDPWRRSSNSRLSPRSFATDSDIVDRVQRLIDFERGSGLRGEIDPNAGRHILRVADQLARGLDGSIAPAVASRSTDTRGRELGLRRAVLAAFPDRVVRRREPGGERGLMVGGRGVRLDAQSAVRGAELFVAVEIQETGAGEALVRLASAIEREWLPEAWLSTAVEVEFDPERERVVARRRVRWRDLLLEESATNAPADVDPAGVLAAAARERLRPIDLIDAGAERLLARVDLLRRYMPELDWPPWGEQEILALLPRLCAGCASFAELRRRSLAGPILETLTGAQLAALDRDAPERLRAPSGSQILVEYRVGKMPTLAVKIQEIFGWTATPRIAGGRAPVLLHLLAPNMRPQQITDDLASFWKGAYLEIRKDLRRRYPKHAWPEDPAQGVAERRPRRDS